MHHFQGHSATGNIFAIAVDISKKQLPMGAPTYTFKIKRNRHHSSLKMAVFHTLWKNNKNRLQEFQYAW